MAVDYNRTSNGSVLPTPVAQEIITKAREASLVMTKANRKPLTLGAAAVTLSNGVSGSKFVGETERKPVGTANWSEKVMRAQKIALVLSFSTEFKRDKAALYRALVDDMPKDLARTFDNAALHGIGRPVSAEFDDLAASPTIALGANVYASLLTGIEAVGAANGDITEWDMSIAGEVALLGAKDGSGRPLFTAGVQSGQVGSVLGRPVVKSKAVTNGTIVGLGVDWNAMFWGMVESIKYEEYNGPIFNANGTLKHAGAQDNMFSVICEVEAAFRTLDKNRAVRFTK